MHPCRLFKTPVWLVIFILLFSGLSSAQDKIPPSFKWAGAAECPVPNVDTGYLRKANMVFGYLTVPENRAKNNGRSLRLAVAVIKARRPDSSAIPLVILHGGPGGRVVAGNVAWQFDMLRNDRDIVLVDQRGSGFSEPEFSPELNREIMELFAKDMSPAGEMEAREKMAARAREKLIEKGIDLSAYNSREIAADINDLCRLLGYKQWDLWGSSYGTRIALTMMRDFPEGIHSVVLESVLPPNVRYFEDVTANFRRSLNLLFDKCAADPSCSVAYPHLKADFTEAIDSLDKKPLVISMNDPVKYPNGQFIINSQDMLLGFQQALYGKAVYPVLPLLIEQVKNRNESALKSFVESMSNGILRLHYGLYYSVICSDCMPFNNIKAFEDSSAGFWQGLTFYKDEFGICRIWNTAPPNGIDSAAVTSNTPVLILEGELDPMAPPSNGEAAKRTLPNSFMYTFQNTGHLVSNDRKAVELIDKFLHDPAKAPDSAGFVATGPIGFATDVKLHSGIASLAPKLQITKANRLYTVWIVLMAVFLLTGIFFSARELAAKNRSPNLNGRDKWGYRLAIVNILLSFFFLIRLGIVISKTASEDFFLLGFGLPRAYSSVLYLPYLIIGLYIIQLLLLSGRIKNKLSAGRKQLLFFLFYIPFIGFIFYFNLFY
jgi:pimeloyl-ACP methyl ester carboxylesterase